MSCLSKLGTGLTIFFALSILALLVQLCYVLCRRRRFRRQTDVVESDVSGGNPSKELLYFFCCKNQSRIKPTGAPAVQSPDAPAGPACDVVNLYGPSRVLFTIEEEEREDMAESEKSSSGMKTKQQRVVSLEESFDASGKESTGNVTVVVVDAAIETPFLTPCASPPYYTPSPSPPCEVQSSEGRNLTYSLETDAYFNLRVVELYRDFPADGRILTEA